MFTPYDMKGMSPIDERVPRTTHHGLGVMEHLVHRDAHRLLVAEHDHAERVADEDERHAGLVDDARGRVVVGGQHRDAHAFGVHLRDVGQGYAANRLAAVGRLGLGRRAHLAANDAPFRVAQANDPIKQPIGNLALRHLRPRIVWLTRHDDRDPVGVRAKARACLCHVVGHEQIDTLALGLVARPGERTGLCREADDDGVVAALARDGDRLGQDVARRLELQRQPGSVPRDLRCQRRGAAGSQPRRRP